jgi:hypothetical protein
MKQLILILLGLALIGGTSLPLLAQGTTVTTPAISATNAVQIAAAGVDPTMRDHIVSVYGVGAPAGIQTWWVIYYDPSVASHGHAVCVENGQITRQYEAKSGVIYDQGLTFAASQVAAEGPALTAAQNYAAEHALAYDQVRVLLRLTSPDAAYRWRVQLLNGATSKGFVFVNTTDGSFAMYSPPGTVHTHTSASTGGVAGDVEQVGNDVKHTFLGIGGDLQEFFTGERTVDQ